MTGNPHLVEFLQKRIQERGPIPFSEYMAAVLYHPEHGYYEQEPTPIGLEGDFYTSANLDPAMGELLAKLFGRMSEELKGFSLVEIGAGTGQLARQILEARAFPYTIVERSHALRRCQEKTLRGFDVEWRERIPTGIHGCVFSNEFFDALPVRRFLRRDGKLLEVFVGEGFSEVEAEPEKPVDLPFLRDGCRADLSFEAVDWMDRIADSITRGYHLAIDYGYLRDEFFARRLGTLMCYRRHQALDDPYIWIGQQDITAHVNFSDLIDRGSVAGLREVGFRTQMSFLLDLGLADLIASLALRPDAAAIRRMQALKNLLLPPMMGERFKVLLQAKGVAPSDLPGFRQDAPL
jgi:SAM-dependent MidA family methyltransferase